MLCVLVVCVPVHSWQAACLAFWRATCCGRTQVLLLRSSKSLAQVVWWWVALTNLHRAGASPRQPTSGWRTRAAFLYSPSKVWPLSPRLRCMLSSCAFAPAPCRPCHLCCCERTSQLESAWLLRRGRAGAAGPPVSGMGPACAGDAGERACERLCGSGRRGCGACTPGWRRQQVRSKARCSVHTQCDLRC